MAELTKADTYLIEGRVTVLFVSEQEVHAKVVGSEPYTVRRIGGVWKCNCPARVSECAHVLAVTKVVPEASAGEVALFEGDGDDLGALFDSLAKGPDDEAWKEEHL